MALFIALLSAINGGIYNTYIHTHKKYLERLAYIKNNKKEM